VARSSDVEAARKLLRRSRKAAAFTGAGVSTASGVPDFRSPGGVWSRYRPVTIQEFRASRQARCRYWLYKKETYADFAQARPNAAHLTLARLEAEGRLLGVITQNIDGLHQEAGSRTVFELHGTNRRVDCLDCGTSYGAADVQDRLLSGCDAPDCGACGGPLKSATISFGQALPSEVLSGAFALATGADLLLVVGSSLLVHPAAAIPEVAARAGADIVLVNHEPTPLDGLATVLLRGAAEDLLPALAS
jgi:NAD-dependent deacetylase